MREITLEDLEKGRIRYHTLEETPPVLPVVTQDAATGAVLMLAWADHEAIERSIKTGSMHYFSRSRGRIWRKGEESGHTQRLLRLWADCDMDTLLAVVEQTGPACHTGAATCFHEAAGEPARAGGVLGHLSTLIAQRDEERPEGSHTTRLLSDENLRLKKLVEEAGELQVALARGEAGRAREEAADLLYHALVALHAAGVRVEDVLSELSSRRS